MSSLAAFALALALACAPMPSKARPLSLIDEEHALKLSPNWQHGATLRGLLMRALPPPPQAASGDSKCQMCNACVMRFGRVSPYAGLFARTCVSIVYVAPLLSVTTPWAGEC